MKPKYHELRKDTPIKEKITEYWKDKLNTYDNQCFACGSPNLLERCHIIPIKRGGTNDLFNLQILCARCHLESEDLTRYGMWFLEKQKKSLKSPYRHIYDKIEKYGFDKKDFEYFFESSENLQILYHNVMVKIYWERYIVPIFTSFY